MSEIVTRTFTCDACGNTCVLYTNQEILPLQWHKHLVREPGRLQEEVAHLCSWACVKAFAERKGGSGHE